MNLKDFILIQTLLKSTSLFNAYKYSKDKKKQHRLIGNVMGFAIIYILLVAYSIAMCVGYGQLGIADSIPTMCAIIISSLAFIFTLFKTNGYLFAFKEYDMLMSLPFEVKTIVKAKFLYMYIKSISWYLSISVAMLIGYAIYTKPFWMMYPIWIILSLILPIIPMLLAAFIGFMIAKIGARFKKTKIIQTLLTFVVILLAFCSRWIIEALFKNGNVGKTLEDLSNMTQKAGNVYWPIKWFDGSVVHLNVGDILLLLGVSLLLFEVIFIVVSKNYRQINSALKSNVIHQSFKMTAQKSRSVVQAIAFKEFKRFLGSTVYMTNIFMGEVFTLLLGIASLFVGIDKLLMLVTEDAPITTQMILPAIPLIIYFFIGMLPTTACSPSLEGKNFWIVKSMPIEPKVLYLGKILFNLYLTIPFMTFATLCLCLSAKAGLLNMVLYWVLGVLLCAFSSCFGCVCGMKYMRLDWENEIEIVKQGTAVAVYLFPNMFITMGLVVGVVALSTIVNPMLVTVLLIAVVALLTWLSLRKVLTLSKKI